MDDKKKKKWQYVDRDVSWMYFNHRILQEASKQDLPPLERLSFLGIYSNNLDEFFRVRMASLNRIEVMAPVYDEDMQRDLLRTIDFALADNTNARIVDGHGGNIIQTTAQQLPFRSQEQLYRAYKEENNNNPSNKTTL